MLKCGRYEDLVMRYFDNDLSGQERKKLDQHLDACSSCRLLLSQLSGILNTLENTESPKPGPDLERLVMEQVMLLPVQLDNNEEYRPVRLIYGTFAGIVASLLWIISLTIQDWDLMDLILAGRSYLDVLSGFMVDMQIVYQIVAGLFPSEMFSLFLSIQFIFIITMFMLAFVVVRTVFGGSTGEYRDVS